MSFENIDDDGRIGRTTDVWLYYKLNYAGELKCIPLKRPIFDTAYYWSMKTNIYLIGHESEI